MQYATCPYRSLARFIVLFQYVFWIIYLAVHSSAPIRWSTMQNRIWFALINTSFILYFQPGEVMSVEMWCTRGHASDECWGPRPNIRDQFHIQKRKRNVCLAVGQRYIIFTNRESWPMRLGHRPHCNSTQHMKVLDVKSSAKQKKRCQSTIISGTAT